MQSPNSLLTSLILCSTLIWAKTGGKTHIFGMDSKGTCFANSVKMEYIEDGNNALVLGKQTLAENQARLKECAIRFKPLSNKGYDYLMLKFESFYINDCGVTLTISQSHESTFTDGITDLVHLKCEQRNPIILYAKKDHTLQFKLSREDIFLRNYNFRINVTLSDGIPKAGPTVAVIIGIAAALMAIIAIIAFILIKYIRLKNSVLRERRAERAIESAIYIYNSQELDNPDAYTNIPNQGNRQNGLRTPLPGDERRMLLNGQTNGHPPHSPCEDIMAPGDYIIKDPLDLDGELPPSYEEALEMPKPPDSPIYANAT